MATETTLSLLNWFPDEVSTEAQGPGEKTCGATIPLDFNQIRELEAQIEQLKKKLQDIHLKPNKRDRQSMKLAEFEANLCKLKACHNQGAQAIQKQSLRIAALPRELRDAIFEKLYVQDPFVLVDYHKVGSNILFDMPIDSSLYMSKLHVGDSLAREAAEIFYMKNTFRFKDHHGSFFEHWTQKSIDAWFTTDHYGSGIIPQDLIRNLDLRLSPPSWKQFYLTSFYYADSIKACHHMKLEEAYKAAETNGCAYRRRLRALLAVTSLRSITFTLDNKDDELYLQLRLLNPVVHEFRSAGIKVNVIFPQGDGSCPEYWDVFDEPNASEIVAYQTSSDRHCIFTDDSERALFDTWKAIKLDWQRLQTWQYTDHVQPQSRAIIRVWLFEHLEVYKAVQRDYESLKALDDLASEFRGMTAEAKDLRRNYYQRIMDHIR